MKDKENPHRYDDIIELPHHVSATRHHMAISDRAAQFSPFAALTGHEAAIKETARMTDRRIELDENSKEILNMKIAQIIESLKEQPVVDITYFVPDDKKDGGSYITVNGIIKKIDSYENLLVLMDRTMIPLDDVINIDGEIFASALY